MLQPATPTKPKKGMRVKIARDIDCRNTGGPFIPKGEEGTILRVRRDDTVRIELDNFGCCSVNKADIRP
jgi:hypothetical protein